MTAVWVSIFAVAVINAVLKAAGPALLGGRELPARAVSVVALLAPALLAGLVISETFREEHGLVLDERSVGVLVAGVALALRAPVLLAVALGVVTTAAIRIFI